MDDPEVKPPERQRPPRVHVVDGLMGLHNVSGFLSWLNGNTDRFMPATVGEPGAIRRDPSRIGYVMDSEWEQALERSAPGWLAEFRARVLKHVPAALAACEEPGFTLSKWDTQVTLYHHRGSYGLHRDRYPESYTQRRLSFAWYVTLPPKMFSGGELVFTRGGTEVEPLIDRLALFHPEETHEVRTVKCWSADPLNGRVTINGWLEGC